VHYVSLQDEVHVGPPTSIILRVHYVYLMLTLKSTLCFKGGNFL